MDQVFHVEWSQSTGMEIRSLTARGGAEQEEEEEEEADDMTL
jgi:hypothetical protein